MYRKKRGGITYKGSGRRGGITYKGSGRKMMKMARLPMRLTGPQKNLMRNKMIARHRLMMKRGMKGGNILKTLGNVAQTLLPLASFLI